MARVTHRDEKAAIAEEQQRLEKLRRTVDATCAVLSQAVLTREEAQALVAAARRDALELFPDKGDVSRPGDRAAHGADPARALAAGREAGAALLPAPAPPER